MVKFATPISTLFDKKEEARKIMEASDGLECRDRSLDSEYPRQWLLHLDHEIIHPWEKSDRDYITKALSRKKELRCASFHMASSCSDPQLVKGMYQPGGRDLDRDEMLGYAKENVHWLKEQTDGRELLIAVENNNYYPTEAYRYVTDADFITDIVKGNQLKFVLDIAHAHISAHNKKISYNEYLKGLPCDELIQVHVSKYAINEDGLAFDAHVLPDDDVINECIDIVKRFQPAYVTIEYYKDKDGLLLVIEKLRKALVLQGAGRNG